MNIKVIELKKYYKRVGIFITCIMCILSLRIIILDTKDMIAKANGAQVEKHVVQADNKKHISDHLFMIMLNKTIPAMEVNYKKENGYSQDKEFIKLALGKLINFDYEDPKTLFEAQMPVLKDIDDDLAEKENAFVFNNEKNDQNQNNDIYYVNGKPIVKEEKNEVVPSSNMKGENTEVAKNAPDKDLAAIQVVSSSIKKPNQVKLDMNKPTIFIYHTHATESYMPEEIGNFHSLKRKYTVRAVGDQLSEYLSNKGYKVIHDDTMHDYPSYQQSYVRSLETLRKNLKKNTSLKIIFDIHRDAAPNNDTARTNSYVTINGEKVAKFSIVVGTGNENAEKLMILAKYIKAKSDERYPGLAKKTITKPYKFNQFNSDYYALIEIGNTANYIDEAVRTTKYVGEILDQVIKDINK
ncbi:stage II sporulation protein P [Marinisporobacter balticus]|uniref:stage II sporulation protein P n=1 Tax=Marinisporobacter balticus TaxID=2018667 RepID=UPI001FAAA1A9|nr:stage II sporulation protein P [Marinisporobacter balticus]